MKIASSILYGGRSVEANICTYGDCDRLKIVCPECREPLFLVMPQEKKVEAYFSHYADEKGIDPLDKCPLRVATATGKAEAIKALTESKEQYKRVFLSRFWSLLEKSPLLIDWEVKHLLVQQAFYQSCSGQDDFLKQKKYQIFLDSLINLIRINEKKIREMIECFTIDHPSTSDISSILQQSVAMDYLQKAISLEAFLFLLGRSGEPFLYRLTVQAIALQMFEGDLDFETYLNPTFPVFLSILERTASETLQKDFEQSLFKNIVEILLTVSWTIL